MIQILPEKTQLEIDLQSIDEPLGRVTARTRANAEDLNQSLDTFWNLPEDRLLAVLNYYGPSTVNNIFTAHARNAQNINALLADRGIGPIARVGATRELTINEQGLFEIVPPHEPDQDSI